MRVLNNCVAAMALSIWCFSAQAVTKGQLAPAFSVQSLAGQSVANAQTQEKITMINFWATWCEACKVELKEMETKFADLRNNPQFQALYVTLDKDTAQSVAWARANLKDPESFIQMIYSDSKFTMAENFGVDAFPMTVVIDRVGKIRHVQRGYSEGSASTDEIASVSSELLKE